MKNMYDEGFDIYRNDVYLQPFDSWEDENISPSYEDFTIKDNGEGK